MDSGENRWELSKENVQPIDGGRRIEKLNESLLKMHDDQHKRELQQEKENFECRLREYNGNDRLQVYCEYLKWMQTTFPTGGKEVTQLLLKIVKEFKNDAKYANDHRYVSAWLTYIQLAKEKLLLFQSLFDLGIGTMVANFYVAWAATYENANNFKRAKEVFEHGVACGAEPRAFLQHKFDAFRQRAFANELASSKREQTEPDENEVRQAMNSLKTVSSAGRENDVDPIRTGPEAVLPQSSGVIKGQQGVTIGACKSNIRIYSDTLVAGMDSGVGGGEYSIALNTPGAHSTRAVDQLISSSMAKRENTFPAAKWNEAPIGNYGSQSESTEACFSIYKDSNVTDKQNEKITAERRTESRTHALQNVKPLVPGKAILTETKVVNNGLRFMLPEAVYAGTTDVSLEELRIQRWKSEKVSKAVLTEKESESCRLGLRKTTVKKRQESRTVALQKPVVSGNPLSTENRNVNDGLRFMLPEAVYTGTTDVSLEELRFLRWKTQKVPKADIIEKESERRRGSDIGTETADDPNMLPLLAKVRPHGNVGKEFSFEELIIMRGLWSTKIPKAMRDRKSTMDAVEERLKQLSLNEQKFKERELSLELRTKNVHEKERTIIQRKSSLEEMELNISKLQKESDDRKAEIQQKHEELMKEFQRLKEMEEELQARQQALERAEQKHLDRENRAKVADNMEHVHEFEGSVELSKDDSSRKRLAPETPQHGELGTTLISSTGKPVRKQYRAENISGSIYRMQTSEVGHPKSPQDAIRNILSQCTVHATPTTNTKFAMNIMQELFDSSSKHPPSSAQDTLFMEEDDEAPVASSEVHNRPRTWGVEQIQNPFEVYREPSENENIENKASIIHPPRALTEMVAKPDTEDARSQVRSDSLAGKSRTCNVEENSLVEEGHGASKMLPPLAPNFSSSSITKPVNISSQEPSRKNVDKKQASHITEMPFEIFRDTSSLDRVTVVDDEECPKISKFPNSNAVLMTEAEPFSFVRPAAPQYTRSQSNASLRKEFDHPSHQKSKQMVDASMKTFTSTKINCPSKTVSPSVASSKVSHFTGSEHNSCDTEIIATMPDQSRILDPDFTFAPDFYSTQDIKHLLKRQDLVAEKDYDTVLENEDGERMRDPYSDNNVPSAVEGEIAGFSTDPLDEVEIKSQKNLTVIPEETSNEKDSNTLDSIDSHLSLAMGQASMKPHGNPSFHGNQLSGIRETSRETSSALDFTPVTSLHTESNHNQSSSVRTSEQKLETYLPNQNRANYPDYDESVCSIKHDNNENMETGNQFGRASDCKESGLDHVLKSDKNKLAAQGDSAKQEVNTDVNSLSAINCIAQAGCADDSIWNHTLLTDINIMDICNSNEDHYDDYEVDEDEGLQPFENLKYNGDHTIIIDREAETFIKKKKQTQQYFTTNPNLLDLKDPYSINTTRVLMSKIKPSLQTNPKFVEIRECKVDKSHLVFGDREFAIDKSFKSISGGFSHISLVKDEENKQWIMKCQKPAFPLEFYYIVDARRRIAKAMTQSSAADWVDISDSICSVESVFVCDYKGSFLQCEYYRMGTLRNLMNALHPRHSYELIIAYLMVELLYIIEYLHKVGIIHGDVKVDNLTVRDQFPILSRGSHFTMPDNRTHVLCLIDFGRGIDMKYFGKEACFMVKSGLVGFECLEIRTGQPWNYQVDLFNVASTLYAMVRNVYMSIRCVGGRWNTTKPLSLNKRQWKLSPHFELIVDTLINSRGCAEKDYPNLQELRQPIEEFLLENIDEYNALASEVNKSILKRL